MSTAGPHDAAWSASTSARRASRRWRCGLDGSELAQIERPTPWIEDGRHAELDPGRPWHQLVRETVAAVRRARRSRRPAGAVTRSRAWA